MSAGNDWGDDRHLVDDAVWGLMEGLSALGVDADDVTVVPVGRGGARQVQVADGQDYLVLVVAL